MIERIMEWVTRAVGHPAMIPCGLVAIALLYAVAGVDVTNIGISIVTFALLPVLEFSQSKNSEAIQAKLDEIVRATPARNELIGIDRRSEAEIKAAREE